MANVDTPRGLQPVRYVSGGPYNGATNQYYHDSGNGVAIFKGDLVTITGASTFVNIGGVIKSLPNVVQSATGDVFQGVCVSVEPETRDSTIYCAASTGRVINVCDDPAVLYEAQDVNSGTPLTANDVGLNVNVVVGTGSTVTGYSGMALDNTTEAVTNTLDLKIESQVNRVDNDYGSAVGTGAAAGKYLVRINRHRNANQIAGL